MDWAHFTLCFSVKVLQMDVTSDKEVSEAYDFISRDVGERGAYVCMLRRVKCMKFTPISSNIIMLKCSSRHRSMGCRQQRRHLVRVRARRSAREAATPHDER